MADLLGIVVGAIVSFLFARWRRAEHRADYNARGWGEAREQGEKHRTALRTIADGDHDYNGDASMIAAHALGYVSDESAEAYLSTHFKRRPAQPLQGPHGEEWQP